MNEQILKEKIRTINPMFTDELLDLLCEFVLTKFSEGMTALLPSYLR